MKSDYLNPWDRVPALRWDHKLGIVIFLVFVVLALMSSYANARTLTTQSKEPWSLSQCDKFGRARSVFNVSIRNHGGWPLWKTICILED